MILGGCRVSWGGGEIIGLCGGRVVGRVVVGEKEKREKGKRKKKDDWMELMDGDGLEGWDGMERRKEWGGGEGWGMVQGGTWER